MVKKYPAPASASMRWGRVITPFWVFGSEASNPPANTILAQYNVPSGKTGYIHGLYISCEDGNRFAIQFTSNNTTYTLYIVMPTGGTIYLTDFIAMNEGLPCDGGTTISIKNINSGVGLYQAGLFIGVV
ncbi:MAG: hypothetical protein QXZ10_04315 [Sulfolobales archaeon]